MREQTYRRGRSGQLLRPFATSAGVESRGYSLGLQRALVDFGAEESFKQAAERVREHYGIEVSQSAIRRYTEEHAAAMQTQQAEPAAKLGPGGVEQMIGELDGSLIPIVTTSAGADQRRTRRVSWREARLALAHASGSVSPCFAATLGGVDEAGDGLAMCVARAGGGGQSRLHCVGDGAAWILDQVKRHFGERAEYLIDFYHVSEYLARAAVAVAGAEAEKWRRQQQEHLRESRLLRVLGALKAGVEGAGVADEEAPVRSCYRYLINRMDYLDYKGAIERGLPIGSGEIESAHRYVVQKRLKLAGAWWKEEKAACMLALRVNRANGDWQAYWQGLRQEAA